MKGVGSDSPFPPSVLTGVEKQVVIVPTVSPDSKSSRKTRVNVVRYTPGGEYVVASRPLYMSVEDALQEVNRLKNQGVGTVAASIVAEKLSGFQYLMEAIGRDVDAVEIDLGLFYALYGFKRGFESYAVDIVEELVSYSRVPLIAKLAPSMPLSRELIYELGRTGINRIVYSTRPVYTIEEEVFRVHSTHISAVFSQLWRELSGKEAAVPSMLASDIIPHEEWFEAILLDVSLVMGKIRLERKIEKKFPEKWLYVPEGLYPAILEDEDCIVACPYGAFGRSTGKMLVANMNTCDLCGFCMSICGDSVTLARELTPG